MAEKELIVWKGPESLRPHLVPLERLQPYPNNPRRGDIARLRESLRRFGQVLPGLVDPALGEGGRKRLVARHHLSLAAAAEGWTHIAVIENTFASEDEAHAYLLADNRLGEIGTYDSEALAQQLTWLGEQESLVGVGYDSDELAEALAALGAGAAAPPPVEPDWQGRYEIVVECADEEEQEALFAKLTEEGRKCRVLTM